VAHGDGKRRSRSRTGTVERLREKAKCPQESGETVKESSDRLTAMEVGGARVHDGGSGGTRV
jgi:hypothetical protein